MTTKAEALRIADDLHDVLTTLNANDALAVQAPGSAYQSTVDALIATLASAFTKDEAEAIYRESVSSGSRPSKVSLTADEDLSTVTLVEDGSSQWAVVEVAHPAVRDFRGHCEGCLDEAKSAAIMARLTGSVGANASGVAHSATVQRIIAMVSL